MTSSVVCCCGDGEKSIYWCPRFESVLRIMPTRQTLRHAVWWDPVRTAVLYVVHVCWAVRRPWPRPWKLMKTINRESDNFILECHVHWTHKWVYTHTMWVLKQGDESMNISPCSCGQNFCRCDAARNISFSIYCNVGHFPANPVVLKQLTGIVMLTDARLRLNR